MAEEQTDSHHSHPNYVKIWAILVGLLVVSVLGPMLGIKAITLITAFGIAVVKALMVAAWFMHLNVEKKFVWYMLLGGLLFMVVLWAGLSPDIQATEGQRWKNLYEEPAVAEHHDADADQAGGDETGH